MEDKGKVCHIDPARRDVGRNEKLDTFFFKSAHHFIALKLGEVALQDFDAEALFAELIPQCDRARLGPTKDETSVPALLMEEVDDEVIFLGVFQDRELMIDIAIHHPGLINSEKGSAGREMIRDQGVNGFGEGCRKKPGALTIRGEAEDLCQLLLKAHTQHLISLIKNEVIHLTEVEGLSVDEVEETPGCSDYDVGRTLESGILAVDGVATTENLDEDLARILGEAEELFPNLLGELAGRGYDETLDMGLAPVDLAQERQSKGSGLASPGLRLGNEVATVLQQGRNGIVLDLGRLRDTKLLQTLDEVWRDTESEKGTGHGGGQLLEISWPKASIKRHHSCRIALF